MKPTSALREPSIVETAPGEKTLCAVARAALKDLFVLPPRDRCRRSKAGPP
jgi:hypothetical protein